MGPYIYGLSGDGERLASSGTCQQALSSASWVYFLQVGYETFESEYPQCYVAAEPLSQEKTATTQPSLASMGNH